MLPQEGGRGVVYDSHFKILISRNKQDCSLPKLSITKFTAVQRANE